MRETDAPTDPTKLRHRNLEKIAMAALHVGRLLMETGARAEIVSKGTGMVVSGQGVETVAIRVGYASLSLTVRQGGNSITRMMQIGHHGVNLRLNHQIRGLCVKAASGTMTPEDIERLTERLRDTTPRHHWLVVAIATGLACASFGQLLGTDAIAFLPIWFAGLIGQSLRHFMLQSKQNVFAVVATVSFISSSIAGLLCLLVGSATPEMAMFSAVLLLVPGVPAMNAQTDIMEGSPTLGSARAVTVMMILIFLTVGVALSRYLFLGFSVDEELFHYGLLHNTLFGAIAAAGFGILFNFRWRAVIWAALGGAIALSVRTLGLDQGWGLAMSSTLAAVVVTLGVRLLYLLPMNISTGGSMLAVAGCIPMISGSAAAHGIFGLLALAGQHSQDPAAVLAVSMGAMLSVLFTIGGIGAGITLFNQFFTRPRFPTE